MVYLQIATFRTMFEDSGSTKPMVDNYRPPQPLSGRTVSVYRSSHASVASLGYILAALPFIALCFRI